MHTWFLMGLDSNKMLNPGYEAYNKHVGLVVNENKRDKDMKMRDNMTM